MSQLTPGLGRGAPAAPAAALQAGSSGTTPWPAPAAFTSTGVFAAGRHRDAGGAR
jgi:hypothetical protein